MFITPSFKKRLILEQFQGNYLKAKSVCIRLASLFIRCYSFSRKPGKILEVASSTVVFKRRTFVENDLYLVIYPSSYRVSNQF